MEKEVKVVRGFAVSMGDDYVEFFDNIEDAKNNYEMMKERFVGVHMCYEKDIKEIEEFTINNVINTILK
jgi:hypothetical protein